MSRNNTARGRISLGQEEASETDEKLEKRTERTTPVNPASTSELVEEGKRLYASQLRNKLEPEQVGEFVVITISTCTRLGHSQGMPR